MEVLAIVGARSGSKGVPDKNIKPLAGKPLMGWIIEAAKQAKLVTRTIISTDSQAYADVAKQFGAEAPFLRPAELAGDNATDYEYVRHAVEWLKEHEQYVPDIVVRLFPPVPLQTSEDIDACIQQLLNDPKADAAVVVAKAQQHPAKALKLVDDGQGGQRLVNYITGEATGVAPTARQGYEPAFFRANVIASRLNTIYTTNSLTGSLVRHYEIPQARAIDIDSVEDFELAEHLIRKYKTV